MFKYDVRQLDCYVSEMINIPENEIDDYLKSNKDVYNWEVNTSYNFGTMKTAAKNVKKALSQYLKRHYNISFYRDKVRYIDDIDFIYIVSADTYEPIFIAIPQY